MPPAPSVVYKVHLTSGEVEELHNPADMPDPVKIARMEEPWIKATILVPGDYLGAVLQLCTERRGQQVEMTYAGNRSMIVYRLPLNEVVFDFYDRLKSVSRGYASFDYEMDGFAEGDLVKVVILVNGEPVDALSFVCHRAHAEARGRAICNRLKDLIPRQLFKIPLQATIGGNVVARETISAMRKDVTAKCYGGDITRKRKLLEKQKEGKKRMKTIGRVEVPQEAFVAAFPRGHIFISGFMTGAPSLGFDLGTHELGATVEASAVATPEPGSMLLLGTGLAGLVRVVRGRSRMARRESSGCDLRAPA